MRRRLDLAVSLITKPKLIIFYDAVTGLNPRIRNQMWSTIENLIKNGSKVITNSQILGEAAYLADRIDIMDKGEIISKGTFESLKKEYNAKNLDDNILKNHGQWNKW